MKRWLVLAVLVAVLGSSVAIVAISAIATAATAATAATVADDEGVPPTLLARSGSGLALELSASPRGVRTSVSGLPSGAWRGARIGAVVASRLHAFPFHPDHEPMRVMRERRTPTSVAFVGTTRARTLELRWTVRSPHAPGDERISTAPVFLLDVEATNVGRRRRPCQVHCELPLPEASTPFEQGAIRGLRGEDEDGTVWVLAWPTDTEGEVTVDGTRIRVSGDLAPRRRRSFTLAWVAYRGAPIGDVDGEPIRHAYTRHFDGAEAVAERALAERASWIEISDAFDASIAESGVPGAIVLLASRAFATVAASTVRAVAADGSDFVTVLDPATGTPASFDETKFLAPLLGRYDPAVFLRLLDGLASPPREASIEGRGTFATGRDPEASLLEATAWLLLLHDRAVASRAVAARAAEADPFPADVAPRARRCIDRLLACDEDADGLPDGSWVEVGAGAGANRTWPRSVAREGSHVMALRVATALRVAADRFDEAASRGWLPDATDFERRVAMERAIDRSLEAVASRAWVGDHFRATVADRESSPLFGLVSFDAIRRGIECAVAPERMTSNAARIRRELGGRVGARYSSLDFRGSRAVELARHLARAWSREAQDARSLPDDAVFDRLAAAGRGAYVDEFGVDGFAPEKTDEGPDAGADVSASGAGGSADDDGPFEFGTPWGVPSLRGAVAFEAPFAFAAIREGRGDLFGYRAPEGRSLRVALVDRGRWADGRVPVVSMRATAGGSVVSVRDRSRLARDGDVYARAARGDGSIDLDLLGGRPPRLRDGSARLLDSAFTSASESESESESESASASASASARDAFAALLLAEPDDGRRRKLVASGLAPGTWSLRVRGREVGRHDAVALREGVEIEPFGEGALGRTFRVRLDRSREAVRRTIGERFDDRIGPELRDVLGALDRRLEDDLAGRVFRVDLVRVDAEGDAGGGAILGPGPFGAAIDGVRPGARGGLVEPGAAPAGEDASGESLALGDDTVPAAVERLFEAVVESGLDLPDTRRVADAVRPVDLEVDGRVLRLTNVTAPEVSGGLRAGRGEVEFDRLPTGRSVELPFERIFGAPSDGESGGTSGEAPGDEAPGDGADAGGAADRLYDELVAELRIDFRRQTWVREHRFALREGFVLDWLVSRVYPFELDGDFVRAEAPQLEGVPLPGAGDANWREQRAVERWVELASPLRLTGRYAVYAHTWIDSEIGGEAWLAGDARGPLRIWWNGRLVFPSGDVGRFDGGAFRVAIDLPPGPSSLMLKMARGAEGLGARVRVETDDPALRSGLRARPVD